MSRLGQLHASVGLAFLVTAASMTACGSTDTPDAEPAAPTSTTAPTTTGETEAPVVDAAAASSPATSIQTSDPSSLEKLCAAVLSWSSVVGMLSLGQIEDISLDIMEKDETMDIEELNEQLHERLESTLVPVENIPDSYMLSVLETFGLAGMAMEGSLSNEHQEFADAFFEFIGDRMETFDHNDPIHFSSLSLDGLPNADVVIEECGLQ